MKVGRRVCGHGARAESNDTDALGLLSRSKDVHDVTDGALGVVIGKRLSHASGIEALDPMDRTAMQKLSQASGLVFQDLFHPKKISCSVNPGCAFDVWRYEPGIHKNHYRKRHGKAAKM